MNGRDLLDLEAWDGGQDDDDDQILFDEDGSVTAYYDSETKTTGEDMRDDKRKEDN